ncbi:MAG TPA: HAD-IC family P-type ATPase [Nocardioidaceae bacterium]|nr:HAD-IC family P-type ATPase [Nocardioidaceae bacterium]
MTGTPQLAAESLRGLTSAEVKQRVEAGLVNRTAARPSRTLAEIFRANVLTRFNALLGALLVVILVVGPIQDALFGLVIVANSTIGIVQELRAKRTLDRLSLLNMPSVTVIRDGAARQIPANEVVADDVLAIGAGDQSVVDVSLLDSDGLEIDESLLTGESEPVAKRPGDEVLSGSFVVAGSARARASRVGEAAYAVALAAEARRFTLVHSEIRDALNRVLQVITWVLVPTAALLVTTQLLLEDATLEEAVRGSVAGVVGMVPEGLVLLTSVAFAAGVVRLGGRGVLVQELPAIEGLARVDVVGIDKTGTLTEGTMTVGDVVPLEASASDAKEVLGALAHADDRPNASMRALTETFVAPDGWEVTDRVPFSSARKWSGVTFAGRGTWLLGAPEMLLPSGSPLGDAQRRAATGHRVLLLARGSGPLPHDGTLPVLEPVALVTLAERLRSDAADTLRYFAEDEVAVKVISGDSPRTVGTIARTLGLAGAADPVDARELTDDPVALGVVMEERSVFGRVGPHQKRAMVRALQRRGHVVAMTGDGVNDVLALKDADIGVAMGSGSPAARGVAQLVLLPNRFDVLPGVVAEGRRIIANIERVANLFLTKTVYVTVLALAVGVAQLPFPFYPRHLTIVSTLTIGVPGFFLALAPNHRRAQPHFLRRVLRFAVPAGLIAATATFAAYALTTFETDLGVPAARTAATVVLFGVGLAILTLLILPLSRLEVLLLTSLVATFACLLAVPVLRDFFALSTLPLLVWASAVVLILVAAAALTVVWWFAARDAQ